MSKVNDLTGQTFGELTVLCRDGSKNGRAMWKYKCSCGNEKTIAGSHLIQKQVISCGCKMREAGRQNGRNNKKDILNQRFGKFIVIAETEQRDNNGSIIWECKCDCGNIHYCSETLLRAHAVQSCGCINYSIGEKKY